MGAAHQKIWRGAKMVTGSMDFQQNVKAEFYIQEAGDRI
jgi:hypothetical protein